MNAVRTIVTCAAASIVTAACLAVPASALSNSSVADRCYIADQRVSTAINNMHDISNKRENAYNDAVTRVTNQLKAAQAAGYNTTQLEADFKTLNADLLAFHNDRLTLESDLTKVLSIAPTECGSGTGNFAAALKVARDQLPLLRADDVKVRVDIRQKIIPDIRAYVTWLKDKAGPTATNQ